MKEAADNRGTVQQRAKRPQSFRFHFGERENAGTTDRCALTSRHTPSPGLKLGLYAGSKYRRSFPL